MYLSNPKCLKCGYEKSDVRDVTGRRLCPKCDDFPEGTLRHNYTPDGTKYRLEFSKKHGYHIRTNFMMFPCSGFIQARLLFYVLGFYPISQWPEVVSLTKRLARQVYKRNIRWDIHTEEQFFDTVLDELEKRVSVACN